MVIEAAGPGDLAGVRTLLQQTGLPLDGVDDLVPTMIVARDNNRIVGTAGVELYADGALLRSVAVEHPARGQRIGHRLIEAALQIARAHGIDTVFLLTTTAADFFLRFGFRIVAREDVPASVKRSVEFAAACPASAVVMRLSAAPRLTT